MALQLSEKQLWLVLFSGVLRLPMQLVSVLMQLIYPWQEL